MQRGKKALLLLACSLCTAALMALWPQQDVLEVETAVVGRGELVQSLLLSGTVQYANQQPCVSLKNGVVRQVYVAVGQQVKSGELLFSLDTSAEEQALAMLYEQRYAQQAALVGLEDAAVALAVQSQLELTTMEAQLLAAIEASQIRATADGIVQAVYVHQGESVMENTLLGAVRGTELEVVASAAAAQIIHQPPGTAAVGKSGKQMPVPLALKQSSAQTLSFQILNDTDWKAGDRVEVELVTNVLPECALVPLAAVSLDGTVWYIEDGRACGAALQMDQHSRRYGAATPEWAGRTVILYPDQHELAQGMAVKGAKTP